MKALIAPHEVITLSDGTQAQRIAWVCEQEYPNAQPLFWIDCDDSVTPDTHYWDGNQILLKP
jgi:hypothetical protein